MPIGAHLKETASMKETNLALKNYAWKVRAMYESLASDV